MDSLRSIIARRRDGHWANKLLAHSSPTTQALAACYDALEAAAAFFELKAKFQAGFSFVNAEAGLVTYQTELFRFDQLYRQFNHAADAVEPMGWALLHELRERIENGYSGWFVPQLGSAWSKGAGGRVVCCLAGRSPAGKISRISSHGTSRSILIRASSASSW